MDAVRLHRHSLSSIDRRTSAQDAVAKYDTCSNLLEVLDTLRVPSSRFMTQVGH